MTQLLANFASDAQRCKLIANKMVETAAREDNGWRDLAKECSAVSADAAVAELQASVGRWIMSPKFRARGSVLSLTVLLQCGPLGAGIDAATLQKFLSTAQRRDRGDRPMRLQGSLAEWLTLLDELAKRSETFHPSIVFQMRCYVDEMQPRKGSETLSIFSEILSGLMLHPPDFAKEENELTRNIATELMQSSEHHNLIPHLRLQASLCDLKLGGKGDACALHMMLVSRLITKIADSDPAGRSVIESAIQCFRRANAALRKQQFAATLLVEHCSRWWPSPDERSAAKDLLCSNRLQDITYVAQQVSHFRGASNDDALVAGKVAELLDPLRAICIELVQKVAEERVCRCELDDIKRKLDLLGGLTRTLQLSDFPTRTKLDELRCAFDEINTALLSQLRLSSLSFLAPEESTFNIALSDLLSKRAVRLPPSVHNLLEENALTDDSSSFKIETRDKELCALRISRTELEAWRRPLEVILRQLAYLQVHKSSLFEHYLSKQREDDEKSSLWEWDEFLAAMETAKMSLLRLGNEQEAHFADLKEAAERMKGAPEKELRVIERIPGLADGRHVSLDGIRVILDLVRFAEPVKGLVNFLEQYRGFSCVESDPNFEALKRMADQINDSSAMDGVTASACRDLSKRLNGLLGALAEDLDDELKSDLQLFTELSRSASVWNFVKDNEFYAAEGLRRFGDEYENVTNLLQGEVYETAVLDQLDLAVRYIACCTKRLARALCAQARNVTWCCPGPLYLGHDDAPID